MNPREFSLDILLEAERRDSFINQLLPARMRQTEFPLRDRSLITEMVYGTVRMRANLDWAISRHSNRPIAKIHPVLLWVLRMAAYQVMYMRIPEYAAVDQAVRLAKRRLGRERAGFVNGVIRALAEGLGDLEYPDRETDPEEYIVCRYSHPRWLVDMWIEQLGLEETEALCEANNRNPGLSLRCNLMRRERDSLAAEISSGHGTVNSGGMAPEALSAIGMGDPVGHPAYSRGEYTVQDEGSMLVSRALGVEAGMNVLDMCAGRGVKTTHILELMGDRGRVLALDINESKLRILKENASRLGLKNFETKNIDATGASQLLNEQFDTVLVDAPCSGLGTLARRPDLRWRREAGDIMKIGSLQSALLREACKVTKPGGVVVYATCTISKKENEEVVGEVVGDLDNVSTASIGPFLPEVTAGHGSDSIQLMPHRHGCDGVFIARIVRDD